MVVGFGNWPLKNGRKDQPSFKDQLVREGLTIFVFFVGKIKSPFFLNFRVLIYIVIYLGKMKMLRQMYIPSSGSCISYHLDTYTCLFWCLFTISYKGLPKKSLKLFLPVCTIENRFVVWKNDPWQWGPFGPMFRGLFFLLLVLSALGVSCAAKWAG